MYSILAQEGNLVFLQNMEGGATSKKLNVLREQIVELLSIIEHELDFHEEEITHLNQKVINKKLTALKEEINKIIVFSETIQKMDSGYKIMILGTYILIMLVLLYIAKSKKQPI